MNDQADEQILDSLLEEFLSGEHPPNLSERIEAAWALEKELGPAEAERVRKAQAAEVDDESMLEEPLVQAKPIAPPVLTPADESTNSRPDRGGSRGRAVNRDRRIRLAAAFALAASAAVILLAYRLVTYNDTDHGLAQENLSATHQGGHGPAEERAAETGHTPHTNGSEPLRADGDPHSGNLDGPLLAENPTSPTADRPDGQPGVGGSGVSSSNAAIPLRMDRLPFQQDDETEPALAETRLSSQQPEAGTVALPDDEIIQLIDSQFDTLWQRLQLQPNRAFEDLLLVRKVVTTLTGNQLPAERIERLLDSRGDELVVAELARRLTRTSSFATHWAELLVDEWLGEGSLPLDSMPVAQLRRSVATQIGMNRPWGEVAGDLLGGEISDTLETDSSVYFAALAGGENHRLVQKVAPTWLNESVACARCHSVGLDGSLVLKASEQDDTVEQTRYWSLLSVLQGIEAEGNGQEGTRIVRDRQSDLFAKGRFPELFFELPNDELKTAEPRLPNGDWWSEPKSANTPREALAAMVSNSLAFDEATVNLAWKLVFGRRLVPTIQAVDDVGIDERRELLRALALQFRARQRSLASLVTWLVGSQPFSLQPSHLTQQQWLAAEDAQLQTLRRAELAFAAGRRLGTSREAYSLESSLAAALRWKSSGVLERTATLAQPAPKPNSRSPQGRQRRQAPIPGNERDGRDSSSPRASLNYALHTQFLTAGELDFIERILSAERLDWSQKVEHVVGLSSRNRTSGRIQELSRELLRKNGNDQRQTLIELLWAVQNSEAG